MQCKACGSVVNENDKVCRVCGKEIDGTGMASAYQSADVVGREKDDAINRILYGDGDTMSANERLEQRRRRRAEQKNSPSPRTEPPVASETTSSPTSPRRDFSNEFKFGDKKEEITQSKPVEAPVEPKPSTKEPRTSLFDLKKDPEEEATFTISKKNEEFQELLDQEFENLRKKQEALAESKSQLEQAVIPVEEPVTAPEAPVAEQSSTSYIDARIEEYLKNADFEMLQGIKQRVDNEIGKQAQPVTPVAPVVPEFVAPPVPEFATPVAPEAPETPVAPEFVAPEAPAAPEVVEPEPEVATPVVPEFVAPVAATVAADIATEIEEEAEPVEPEVEEVAPEVKEDHYFEAVETTDASEIDENITQQVFEEEEQPEAEEEQVLSEDVDSEEDEDEKKSSNDDKTWLEELELLTAGLEDRKMVGNMPPTIGAPSAEDAAAIIDKPIVFPFDDAGQEKTESEIEEEPASEDVTAEEAPVEEISSSEITQEPSEVASEEDENHLEEIVSAGTGIVAGVVIAEEAIAHHEDESSDADDTSIDENNLVEEDPAELQDEVGLPEGYDAEQDEEDEIEEKLTRRQKREKNKRKKSKYDEDDYDDDDYDDYDDDDYDDDDYYDEKSGGAKSIILTIVSIIAIIIVLVVLLSAIVIKFMPGSLADYFVRDAITLFQEKTGVGDFLPGLETAEKKTDVTSEDGEENQPAESAYSEEEASQLVASQMFANQNIKSVLADPTATFNSVEPYKIAGVNTSLPSDGTDTKRDEASVATVIGFASDFVSYVNDGSDDILSKTNGSTEITNAISDAADKHNPPIDFIHLGVGDIRHGSDTTFVWTKEIIKDGDGAENITYKVYALKDSGDTMQVVNFETIR